MGPHRTSATQHTTTVHTTTLLLLLLLLLLLCTHNNGPTFRHTTHAHTHARTQFYKITREELGVGSEVDAVLTRIAGRDC